MEHLYDGRGADAGSPFQNDVLPGTRLALNDVQSTEWLFGVISDLDSDARFVSIEASRRIGDRWKLSIEGRAFAHISENDPLHAYRRDDYLQVKLARYF